MTEGVAWSEARYAHYEFTLELQASCDRVWQALTEQVGQWWLPSFHMLGESSTVHLEAHAGGRLYECKDGTELLWYTVIAITPKSSLEMAGHCSVRYGGAASTMLSIDLNAIDSQRTEIKVSDSLFGRVTDGLARSLKSGWIELFTDGLQSYLSKQPA